MDEEKIKYMCQCSKCGGTFDVRDADIREKTYGGVSVNEKICPHCGSDEFTMFKHIGFLNRIWINHEREKRRWSIEI